MRFSHRLAALLRLHSIRARLSAAMTAVIACLLIAADLALTGYARRDAFHHADRALSDALATVQASLRNEYAEARERLDKENEAFAEVGQAPFAAKRRAEQMEQPVLDPAAEAIRETQTALTGDEAAVLIRDDGGKYWISAGAEALQRAAVSGKIDEHDWRLREQPHFEIDGKDYSILAGVSWGRTEAALNAQAKLLALLTLFVVPVTAAGAWLMIGGTLRPIDLIARQAGERSARLGRRDAKDAWNALRREKWVERAPVGSPEAFGMSRPHLFPPSPDAEIVRLVDTMNTLLDSAVEAAEERGRFYIAASHELRTPLHVLAGRVELALSRDRSTDEYRASLAEVQEQSNRLIALVQSLLLLNRIEHDSAANHRPDGGQETTCVSELCARLKESLKPRIEERNLLWRQEFPAATVGPLETEVTAIAASHVEIILRNLMDNAARYTPCGGEVSITFSRSEPNSALRIDIANQSAPLPENKMAHVLEPFYRPDSSRSAETGGSGLGLSICRMIAEKNGWDFSLSQRDGWFRGTVIFSGEAL